MLHAAPSTNASVCSGFVAFMMRGSYTSRPGNVSQQYDESCDDASASKKADCWIRTEWATRNCKRLTDGKPPVLRTLCRVTICYLTTISCAQAAYLFALATRSIALSPPICGLPSVFEMFVSPAHMSAAFATGLYRLFGQGSAPQSAYRFQSITSTVGRYRYHLEDSLEVPLSPTPTALLLTCQ